MGTTTKNNILKSEDILKRIDNKEEFTQDELKYIIDEFYFDASSSEPAIIVKIGDALVSSNIEQHVFHSIYYAPGNLSRDGQRIDFVFNPGDKEIRKGPNTTIIDLTADYYKVSEYKKSLQTK